MRQEDTSRQTSSPSEFLAQEIYRWRNYDGPDSCRGYNLAETIWHYRAMLTGYGVPIMEVKHAVLDAIREEVVRL